MITSDSNALRFFARFRSPLIRLCASCKRRRLVLIACRLADKDLNQRSKKQHKKGSISTLSEAARIIYSKYFILGALIFQAKSRFCNSCELGTFSNRSKLIRAKPSKRARVNEVLASWDSLVCYVVYSCSLLCLLILVCMHSFLVTYICCLVFFASLACTA